MVGLLFLLGRVAAKQERLQQLPKLVQALAYMYVSLYCVAIPHSHSIMVVKILEDR